MTTDEIRDYILNTIKTDGPTSTSFFVEDLASVAPGGKVTYQLTALRQKGLIFTKKYKWHLATKKKKKVATEPTTSVEPPPTSIRLLLLAAREGIDEALARMDALETALLGGTESP